MPNREAVFHHKTQKKSRTFFSLAIPFTLAIWGIQSVFSAYTNPKDFSSLPPSVREEHITSLIFRLDPWLFPFSLSESFSSKISLSLTDSIPFMAFIFKLLDLSHQQYFGIWYTGSFILFTFFAYRICTIFYKDNAIAIGTGTTFFILMPFIWYHALHVPWMAGLWLILWAYSIYFKKKTYFSQEWVGIMIIASLVHPYFSFIVFWIMLADITHLYIYNHKISSAKAAMAFGIVLASGFLTMSLSGIFYTASFAHSSPQIPPLSLYTPISENYNPSYLSIGRGLLIGFIISVVIAFYYFFQVQKQMFYYRALIGTLLIFFGLSTLGGLQLTKDIIIPFSWGEWSEKYFYSVFTSGPKFFIPILLLFPIIVISTAHKIEKQKKHWGNIYLIMIGIITLTNTTSIPQKSYKKFQELDTRSKMFLQDSSVIEWVFINAIPYRPPLYEKLAYYTYQNKLTLNAAPVTRFPTAYVDTLYQTKQNFFDKNFVNHHIYVIEEAFFPQEFYTLGEIHRLEDYILFKPLESNPVLKI